MTDGEKGMSTPDPGRLKALIPQLETMAGEVEEGRVTVHEAVTELCEMGIGVDKEGTDVLDYRDRPKEDLVRGIRYAIEQMNKALTHVAES